MDKQLIEEMLKLDIEQSVSGYSAFINNIRISKAKPLSVSKTVISLDCPKKYIYEAVGIPKNAVMITEEEYKLLKKQDLFMKDYTVAEVLENETKKTYKEMAKKIMNDISSDILIVNTKEYGNIEVVPVERLQEIIQTLGVNE